MKRMWYDGARKFARFQPVLAAVGLSLVVACYPGEITNVAQTDIVATLFDRTADWGSFQEISVLDTIVHIVEEGDTLPISRDFDQEIINLVRQNYAALGYTLVDPDAVDPDNPPQTFALIEVTASTTTVIWQNWPWWGGWGWYPGWPGWGPGWGWGYPCCGGVSGVQYTTGTLLIDMLNAQDAVGDTIPILWSAAINGLLSSSTASTSQRLTRNINQAFTQSEYLAAGQSQ